MANDQGSAGDQGKMLRAHDGPPAPFVTMARVTWPLQGGGFAANGPTH